jgi:outer membrane protein TolC
MIFRKNKILLITILLTGICSLVKAQNQTAGGDSLSLSSTVKDVVQNHPAVRKAMEDLNVSNARIGAANASKQPFVDFEASYSRMGPVSTISIPGLGSFSFMPHDNYSTAFNLNQNIYDFGKTNKNIAVEKQGKELNIQTVEQVKQKLAQSVISTYYMLVYLQEAIKIKDQQLQTLQQHLDYVQKRQATGSATKYEVLTTQVRISATQNQKTDLQTARKIQVAELNSLLGRPESANEIVKFDLTQPLGTIQYDSLISASVRNRDEIKLAMARTKQAQLRYDLAQTTNHPVINGFVSGGIRNGYIPDLYKPTPNFVAGVGLKVPVFDGKRNKYSLSQAQSAIQESNEDVEMARRNVTNEVVESLANVNSSQQKVDQNQLQVHQASQAFSLAQVSYQSGVITNLELLDVSTALSESNLSLLKARIDNIMNLYKLKWAIGERLY